MQSSQDSTGFGMRTKRDGESVGALLVDMEAKLSLQDAAAPRKKVSPLEHQIQKTEQRIMETDRQIQQSQENMEVIRQKSEQLNAQEAMRHRNDAKEEQAKKQMTAQEFWNSGFYNKRNQYAELRDLRRVDGGGGSGGSDSRGSERGSAMKEAASTMYQNVNLYQHIESTRKSPFGNYGEAANVVGRMTSSSAYGHFFK